MQQLSTWITVAFDRNTQNNRLHSRHKTMQRTCGMLRCTAGGGVVQQAIWQVSLLETGAGGSLRSKKNTMPFDSSEDALQRW